MSAPGASGETPLDRLSRADVSALSHVELHLAPRRPRPESARDLVRDGLPAFPRTEWMTRRGIPKRR